jgi:hypothetical protein
MDGVDAVTRRIESRRIRRARRGLARRMKLSKRLEICRQLLLETRHDSPSKISETDILRRTTIDPRAQLFAATLNMLSSAPRTGRELFALRRG